MNHEKDETVPMEEEVRITRFLIIILKYIYLLLLHHSICLFRIKMSVFQVKQQQIVVQINIKLKQTMMKKKTNQFILNQVFVPGGRNDVKQFVFCFFNISYKN